MDFAQIRDDLYKEHLGTIDKISFTLREIDVIACIVHRRGNKKIAELLSISHRTVEAHVRNIIAKLNKSSKEDIIDFIEQSGKSLFIRKYYVILSVQHHFKNSLIKIGKVTNQTLITINALNLSDSPQASIDIAWQKLGSLKKDLKLTNIICASSTIRSVCYVVNFENQLDKKIVISFDGIKYSAIGQLTYIDFQQNYYFAVFDLVQSIISNTEIQNIREEFYKNYNIGYTALLNQEERIGNNSAPKKLVLSYYIIPIVFFLLAVILLLVLVSKNQRIQIHTQYHPKNIDNINANVTWNIPRQDHIFVGREKLLKDIDTILNQHQALDSVNKLAINACTGLGGVGKTQLALQYVHHTKHPYTLKAWFPAENTNNLYTKYIEFAKALGYAEVNYTKETIIEYIKKWLANHPRWLLVYDNVNNYHEIESFLPDTGGHIILTTRQRNWPTKFTILPIDIMSEEEAVKTIKSLTRRDISIEINETKELAQILGYLPLALAQASAYIQQNNITIKEYLSLYKKNELKLLADNTFPEGMIHHPVAITWDISLKGIVKETKIKNELPIAIELLTVCSYLSPDRISRKILLTWLKEMYPDLPSPELVLNRHLTLLWQYSMINYNDDKDISIHRLVQTILRYQLQQALEGKNNICPTLDLKWFSSLLRFFINNEGYFKLANSFKQLIETANLFKSSLGDKYDENFAELDLLRGVIYYFQEKNKEFFQVLNKVNTYIQSNNGSEFLKCKVLYLYSTYFRREGNYDKAEKAINNALSVFNNIKIDNLRKENDLKNLQGILFYNKARLTSAKLLSLGNAHRTKKATDELAAAIKLIQEAKVMFHEIRETRFWLKTIVLNGTLLVLSGREHEVIEEFNKHHDLFDTTADDRTKMLFYLTYCDAYFLNKDFKSALQYCNEARQLAAKLNLNNELKNIDNKRKAIKMK